MSLGLTVRCGARSLLPPTGMADQGDLETALNAIARRLSPMALGRGPVCNYKRCWYVIRGIVSCPGVVTRGLEALTHSV